MRGLSVRRAGSLCEREIQQLTDVLIDCVEGGASISFMNPLARDKAEDFWRNAAQSAERGERILLLAEDAAGLIAGTVQIVFAQPENQPHRADVAKMLVRRQHRRAGIGASLLTAAEAAALQYGRTLLVLDTATGAEGERLYARSGWQRCGVIPGYALWPDGRPCATTIFYKFVGAALTDG